VRLPLALLAAFCGCALAQEKVETRELAGTLGSRSALAVLHSVQRPDGGWRVTGEYVLLPTLQRRFLEGERSPELGVTTLKEGVTAILFGHDPTGELRGTWRGGVFKGTRYGPGGQERERFELSEEFPSMAGYGAAVRCEAEHARYAASLSYAVEKGSVKSFDWRSRVQPGGHSCHLSGLQQQPFRGGLQLAAGPCRVTLRELGGEVVKVAAEGCSSLCGSQAYLEPMLVERRGNCRLLLPEAR
jgi:hypothetical protein